MHALNHLTRPGGDEDRTSLQLTGIGHNLTVSENIQLIRALAVLPPLGVQRVHVGSAEGIESALYLMHGRKKLIPHIPLAVLCSRIMCTAFVEMWSHGVLRLCACSACSTDCTSVGSVREELLTWAGGQNMPCYLDVWITKDDV